MPDTASTATQGDELTNVSTAPEIESDPAATAAGLDAHALIRQAFATAPPGEEEQPDDSDESDGTDDGADGESAKEADGEDEEHEGAPPELTGFVSGLQHIQQVYTDPSRIGDVPEPMRPLVVNAVNAIISYARSAAESAHAEGLASGERMAVLNELFNEDREAFEAATAESGEAQAFYEWKAGLAAKAGINTEEVQAFQGEAESLLAELDAHSEAKARVLSAAKAQGLRANAADLRKLQRLVDREHLRLETQSDEQPLAADDDVRREAQKTKAAVERMRALPKPDVGAGSRGSGHSGLLAKYEKPRAGMGSALVREALAGAFNG